MKNLTTAALGPVTAADFKQSIHMLEIETDDDALIDALIASAVAVVDTATAHPYAAADYLFDLPIGGWRRWWFPVRPVNSVSKVEWMDIDGTWHGTDAGGAYVLQGHDEPQLIVPADLSAQLRCAQGARVTANAGGDPTENHRQAVIMTVKEWRDAGIALEGVEPAKVSFHVGALINQVRYKRPQIFG